MRLPWDVEIIKHMDSVNNMRETGSYVQDSYGTLGGGGIEATAPTQPQTKRNFKRGALPGVVPWLLSNNFFCHQTNLVNQLKCQARFSHDTNRYLDEVVKKRIASLTVGHAEHQYPSDKDGPQSLAMPLLIKTLKSSNVRRQYSGTEHRVDLAALVWISCAWRKTRSDSSDLMNGWGSGKTKLGTM